MINFFKSIFRFLSQGHWIRPVTRQWPLLLFFIILIGGASVTKNLYYRAFIIFFQAYCVTALAHLTKSKIVKGLIYFFCYVLFATETILIFTYGMHISPTTLTLLLETDKRETTEFLTTLISQPQFWMALAVIAAVAVANVFAEIPFEGVTMDGDTQMGWGDKVDCARCHHHRYALFIMLLVAH